ncbi:MAG: [FeFe] hydrogenase H-cluster radical SAM maturase HydG [Candidatus Omnitrophica bacterium]|nr:[FeFe] hydrogenase H-cluster radical SAM maturase HydG [Candidatus Omnitrophota bacterium]
MKYINEDAINDLLNNATRIDEARLDEILAKAKSLERLTLKEAAHLLAVQEPSMLNKIFDAAAFVKNAIYGKRVVLFAPLYISNYCLNNCAYCAFKADNKAITRKALSMAEITKETQWLLSRGHKRILLVAGESRPKSGADYYVNAIKAIYAASVGPHRIRRVNINCAPLSVGEYKKLKAAGIGTYQLFQETYHEATYRAVHPQGPKSDPDHRIEAIDQAFLAGIDDVGIGVLYGLYDYKFDTLGLLSHIAALERTFKVGPHTISVPRIEPAQGVVFSEHAPYAVSDDDFKKVVAVLRLCVPYTGIILSTRESASMRDALFNLGISQASAESKTAPGAYGATEVVTSVGAQFSTADHRTLDEVMASLLTRGFIPSFCTACYRKERTGEAFMCLAKPGMIKGKCSVNALITLKEYLDNFASVDVRAQGYRMIESLRKELPIDDQKSVQAIFAEMQRGKYDELV